MIKIHTSEVVSLLLILTPFYLCETQKPEGSFESVKSNYVAPLPKTF